MTASDFIFDTELEAENCSRCGVSWRDCLKNTGRGPEGVCCGACHHTDTHNAKAARRRERERRNAERRKASPSGDALDRATKLILETGHNKLVTEVARLIDRADAAASVVQIDDGGPDFWSTNPPLEAHLKNVLEIVRDSDVGRQPKDRHEGAALELLRGSPAPRLTAVLLCELEFARWRMNGQRIDLNTATRQRDIRDRQAREFRTAAERAAQERDTAQRVAADRQAGIDTLREELTRLGGQLASANRRIEAGAEGLTTAQLLEELERRLIDGETARRTVEENS